MAIVESRHNKTRSLLSNRQYLSNCLVLVMLHPDHLQLQQTLTFFLSIISLQCGRNIILFGIIRDCANIKIQICAIVPYYCTGTNKWCREFESNTGDNSPFFSGMSPLFMSASLVDWKKVVFSWPPWVFSCRLLRSLSISWYLLLD